MKAARDVTVFVCSTGSTTEGEGREFCTLSSFQYIMLTRGILWGTATVSASLCPLSRLLSLFLFLLCPSYGTARFISPLTLQCVPLVSLLSIYANACVYVCFPLYLLRIWSVCLNTVKHLFSIHLIPGMVFTDCLCVCACMPDNFLWT